MVPKTRAPPSRVETGWSMPENWVVGRIVRIAVMNTAATWLEVNVADEHAQGGGGRDVEQRADRQHPAAPLERHAEDDDRHQQQDGRG